MRRGSHPPPSAPGTLCQRCAVPDDTPGDKRSICTQTRLRPPSITSRPRADRSGRAAARVSARRILEGSSGLPVEQARPVANRVEPGLRLSRQVPDGGLGARGILDDRPPGEASACTIGRRLFRRRYGFQQWVRPEPASVAHSPNDRSCEQHRHAARAGATSQAAVDRARAGLEGEST
jgi:hypothetical protein